MKYKKPLLIVISAFLVIGCTCVALFFTVMYPQLKPMMSWNSANVLSERLSHITSEDFKILSISIPVTSETLSSEDARRLIARLYSTGRFPDWKPDTQLKDFNDQPFVFSVRPRDSGSSQKFIVGVTSSSIREVIEH
jgi:hypothetical protein